MISINPNINFTKKNKYALVFSIILVLVSAISIFSNGLNLGIDFTKGTRFDFETNNNLTEIKNAINKTQILKDAKTNGVKQIKAEFIPTQKNKPAETFLSDYGFMKQDEFWVYNLDNNIKTPKHLKVEVE